MQSPFEYRSYIVASEDGRYTARSMDGEPCSLQSRYVLRVLRGIDVLWTSLEISAAPAWFSDWMNHPTPSIDLDAALNDGKQPQRDFHAEMASILKFPNAPLSVVRSAAALASVMLALKSANIVAMMGVVAA